VAESIFVIFESGGESDLWFVGSRDETISKVDE